MVTHPSTNLYLCCLTSNSLHTIILPLSYWYSRDYQGHILQPLIVKNLASFNGKKKVGFSAEIYRDFCFSHKILRVMKRSEHIESRLYCRNIKVIYLCFDPNLLRFSCFCSKFWQILSLLCSDFALKGLAPVSMFPH